MFQGVCWSFVRDLINSTVLPFFIPKRCLKQIESDIYFVISWGPGSGLRLWFLQKQTYPCPSLHYYSNQCQDWDFTTKSAKHIKKWFTLKPNQTCMSWEDSLARCNTTERVLAAALLLPLLMCLSPPSLRFCSCQTNAGHEDNHQGLIWYSIENETILLWVSNVCNLNLSGTVNVRTNLATVVTGQAPNQPQRPLSVWHAPGTWYLPN